MRVLLVEDDAMIGASVQQGLRQDSFSVDWVRDGRSAETALATHTYDVLLLDLGLPDKAGADVLKALRRTGADIAVLIVTARHACRNGLCFITSRATPRLNHKWWPIA